MRRKREGFTLVELLIVIIIVAIMAGMLLLSSGAAISSAEATKIVSDIRMLHTALLSYYLDNNGLPPVGTNGSTTPLSAAEIKSICAYIDRDMDVNRYGAVYLTESPAVSDGKVLLGLKYVQNVNGVSTNLAGVNQRLSKMAAGSGLCDPDGSVFQPTSATEVVYIWLK